MTDTKPTTFIAWRFHLVITLIIILVFGLFLRVFGLTVLKQKFLQQQGDERVLRLVKTPAFRGIIQDRNGFPLAVSTKVFSIWINPQTFNESDTHSAKIAALLQLKPSEVAQIAQKNRQNHKEFAYLKRGIAPDLANKIKSFQLPGLYTREEFKRFYPEGEIASQVVGFTNVDDEGQEGLELSYNQWLRGSAGKKWVVKDRLGRIIDDIKTLDEQKAGNDLILSIDKRIQYNAYRELLNGITANKANSGSVVVLDVKSGEILAIVNLPSFNPNNRPAKANTAARNRAVTDTFEPGSTIKAFTVASGLESGTIYPKSQIDTSPGFLRVDRNIVKDEHNNGVLSISEILQKSSNVGATKIVLDLPPDQFWSLLHRVGFGEITGVGFPGEQSGNLIKHSAWGTFGLATLSFGYGLSVTTLQLARAYGVLANGGLKQPISILKLTEDPSKGERVIPAKVAKQMLLLLETVTAQGTGKSAQIPGFRVAGKSGTAKIVGKKGYEKHHYISSFVGIAPLTDPRFVVAVVIHDPQGKHYLGGQVSGPVFEKIMESTLRLYDIAPDKPFS